MNYLKKKIREFKQKKTASFAVLIGDFKELVN